MTTPMDFPANPLLGQDYTAPSGTTYVWNGFAWDIGLPGDPAQESMDTVGGLLRQVRSLLQDIDNSSGQYRYSTDSILLCLNQGLVDLYRVRPDIFLVLGFEIPSFNASELTASIGIEMQYISPLIFYTVGLVQARDDEETQDARAAAFLKTFRDTVLTVS